MKRCRVVRMPCWPRSCSRAHDRMGGISTGASCPGRAGRRMEEAMADPQLPTRSVIHRHHPALKALWRPARGLHLRPWRAAHRYAAASARATQRRDSCELQRDENGCSGDNRSILDFLIRRGLATTAAAEFRAGDLVFGQCPRALRHNVFQASLAARGAPAARSGAMKKSASMRSRISATARTFQRTLARRVRSAKWPGLFVTCSAWAASSTVATTLHCGGRAHAVNKASDRDHDLLRNAQKLSRVRGVPCAKHSIAMERTSTFGGVQSSSA